MNDPLTPQAAFELVHRLRDAHRDTAARELVLLRDFDRLRAQLRKEIEGTEQRWVRSSRFRDQRDRLAVGERLTHCGDDFLLIGFEPFGFDKEQSPTWPKFPGQDEANPPIVVRPRSETPVGR